MKEYGKPLRSIFLVGFLLTFALALTSYVDSSFLGTLVDIKTVGIVFSLGSLASIVFLTLSPNLLKIFGIRNLFHLNSLLYLLSVLFMINVENPIIFKILFVIYVASGVGIYFIIDILIEQFSKNRITGNIRGFYLAIYNLAFLFAPLLAGIILKNNPFSLVYLLSGIFVIIMGFVYTRDLENINFAYEAKRVRGSFMRVFREKEIKNVHMISFLLSFFFCLMTIYMPIYLNQFIRFDWAEIGGIFALMHIPYVSIELPLGRFLDKLGGEKKTIVSGLAIIGVSTILLPLMSEHNFGLWAFMLSLTRIGASFVQIGSESFFWKKVSVKDSGLIATFRDTSPLAYILGPLFATAVLSFTNYRNLFIILGLIMIMGIYFGLGIKEHGTRISHPHK